MKTCNYCWRDNVDNALRCFDCGKPFRPSAVADSGNNSSPTPRIALGVAVFLLAAALLGWLLLLAEHSKRRTHERRSVELASSIAGHDEAAANLQRKLGNLKDKHDALWEDYFRLEAQNKQLQEQSQKYADQLRSLEKNVAKLEGMLQERQTANVPAGVPKRAAEADGPLPTDVRLASGTVVQALSGDGKGELRVDNLLSSDVIVKLVRPYDGWCVAAFYLRSKDKHTLTGIPDGSYILYYATGYDYDQFAKDFKRGRSTKKDDSTFDFSTRNTGWTITATRINYTLGLLFGNTRVSPVSGAEFDRYKSP